jgi:SNF2 family DNA or RNA helicase
MTPLQLALYCHFLESKATRSLFAAQKAARVLSAITSLRKLLNHPKLIYDALHRCVLCVLGEVEDKAGGVPQWRVKGCAYGVGGVSQLHALLLS